MKEIWRDIKDYEGLYQVSNIGRVKSLKTNEVLTNIIHHTGYYIVCLHKNGEQKNHLVHRLVAEAFLPKEEGKNVVNHKFEDDKGKKMNIVYLNDDGLVDKEKSTIEWCDTLYNNTYGSRCERVSDKLSKPILQFTKSGSFIREWSSATEVFKQLGYSRGHIADCCRGERKSANGYIWRYKEKGED